MTENEKPMSELEKWAGEKHEAAYSQHGDFLRSSEYAEGLQGGFLKAIEVAEARCEHLNKDLKAHGAELRTDYIIGMRHLIDFLKRYAGIEGGEK